MNTNEIRPAQLVIYDRDGQIKTILMNQQQVTIGRDKLNSNCDVLLASELVSSVHGAFVFYNGEYYYLDDASNVNGTFINGKKINKEPGKAASAQKLRDGDILSIGVTSISKERTVYILFSTSTCLDYYWNAFSIPSIQSELTVGRDCRVSDIVVPEPTVSKKHAVISRDRNGNICVTDCRSVNGTILNGSLIKPDKPVPLNERDTIIIGSTKIIHFGNVIIYNQAISTYQQGGQQSYYEQNQGQQDFGGQTQDYYGQNQGQQNFGGQTQGYNGQSQYRNGVTHSVMIENKDVVNSQLLSHHVNNNNADNYSRKGGVELRVEKLSKIVPCKKGTGINGGDKKYILEDVSLTIYPGELVAILGGSGAGKTTLMNAINGFEPATSGQVYINGSDLYKNYQSYKAQIGYVPQQDIVYDNLTMEDMLTYVAKLRLPGDYSKEEIAHRVDDVLAAMALQPQKHTLIKKLSGGQKKRASIAVELISDPSLFFLDEPTSGLDPEAETNLMKQLKMLSSQKGKTTIVITHTLQNIHLFDKVIFMAPGGKLCFYGSPDEAKKFFEVDNLADAYEKISADINKYVQKYNMNRQ